MGSGLAELVLERGLPPVPDALAPGERVAVARWIGDGWGAVAFLRRRRDDLIDDTTEILEWTGNGWNPAGDAGAAGPGDPRVDGAFGLRAPAELGNGRMLATFGTRGAADVFVHTVVVVAGITVVVESPVGTVLVGLTVDERATVSAGGQTVRLGP